MRRQWSSISRLWTFAAVAVSVLGVSAAGRAAPRRPAPASLQRLQAAAQQLRQAQQLQTVTPGKEAELRLQAALDTFNAARTAAYGPSDVHVSSGRGSFDGTVSEVEPNNDTASATSLDAVILREGAAVVAGEIRPSGDADFVSFFAPAGTRVWAYVDTGGTASPGGNSRDSVLTLLNTDQTTVLEEDDDDGTGNGCDATIESTIASVIAGRTVGSTGTYFLKVSAFGGAGVISPYRLYVALTTSVGISDTEPNETPDTANTLVPIGARQGLANGTAAGADVDVYRLALQEGDVATIQLDEDPTRDSTASNEELSLLGPSGSAILSTFDDGPDGSAGEGFCFQALTAGVYFVRVNQVAATAATDYALLASVCTRRVLPNAPSVINGVLGSGSADYPAISGKQVGRITRDGVVSNSLSPKPFPGFTATTGLRAFDAYFFQNRTAVEAPVTIELDTSSPTEPFSVVYSAFDPGNVATEYLADAGHSGSLQNFSLRVAPGEVFVVVVHEVDIAAAIGMSYTLKVSGDFRSSLVGCPANIIVSNDPNQGGAVVNYNAPGVTDPSLGPVVCSPASGSFFPIGDTLVTCRDQAGNSCSFTVTVKDKLKPTIFCPSHITVNLDQPSGATVSWMVNVADNAPGSTVACTPDSGSVFPLGTTLVNCTATDAAGNTSTCSFNVTVRDPEAPVITCPSAVTVNQTQANGALVTYAASATDNSGSVNFTSSPSSGTVFPLGATIVTCTASDAAGNTTVRTFIVTVKDTQAPAVTCPSSAAAVQDQAGGAVVSYTVSTSDNAGSVNLTCSPASGSFFPLGATTVTCVAVDTSGNVSTCSFPVTVTAPSSTAGAKASGSGTIANGSPAAKFKINASVGATGVPKLTFTHTQTGQALKSTSVSAVVKSGTLVKIFGKLRNGAGPEREFLLEVRDVAKPGATKDTYRLDVRGGFQLAQTVIATGEITVK